MLIRSKRLPSTLVDVRGTGYQFADYQCDIPTTDALYLLRNSEFESAEPFPTFNPDSWLQDRKVLWNGPFNGPANTKTGFGLFSEQIMAELAKIADVYAIDTTHRSHLHPDEYEPGVVKLFQKPLDRLDLFQIKVSLYHQFEPPELDYTIGYTMFETSRLPVARVPILNHSKRVWVPCQQNVESFTDSGVTKPIDVMPLGFSPRYFPYIQRKLKTDDEPFVFGIWGKLTRRKGVFEAIEAFREEFGPDENVRLVIHTNQPFTPWIDLTTDRIETDITRYKTEEMTEKLLSKIDCGVFPTKGEGWGLPSLESAATGLPTIVTQWSGTPGYANDTFLPLKYELEPTWDFPPEWGYIGDWAKVDVKDLRKQMRWVFDHKQAAMDLGKRSSDYVHANFTWTHAAKRIVNRLDELAKDTQ